MIQPRILKLTKDEILCLEGNTDSDLFILNKGRILACKVKGTEVTPLAWFGSGDYIGELSFFDHNPRAATLVCMEDCVVMEIPPHAAEECFPPWLITLAESVTRRIRLTDDVIANRGIRRTNVDSIKPLDLMEQHRLYKIISKAREKNSIA
jgi:CRP/FNR family cyclic AMP-dependent transcriptional regulator